LHLFYAPRRYLLLFEICLFGLMRMLSKVVLSFEFRLCRLHRVVLRSSLQLFFELISIAFGISVRRVCGRFIAFTEIWLRQDVLMVE